MIPAGYLLKRPTFPPEYLRGVPITDVCSASSCVNEDALDLEEGWRQNKFGFANRQDLLWTLADQQGSDVSDAVLFYYEVYDEELESNGSVFDPRGWRPLTLMPTWAPDESPALPTQKEFLGYDVVVFGDGALEHSPLACQEIARQVEVNEHCLIDSLQRAKDAIDAGAFVDCKAGIYRVLAVHRVVQLRR